MRRNRTRRGEKRSFTSKNIRSSIIRRDEERRGRREELRRGKVFLFLLAEEEARGEKKEGGEDKDESEVGAISINRRGVIISKIIKIEG